MISKEDIEKLAKLGRIELKDDEKETLAKEIGGILSYIDQITKTAGKESVREKESVRNVMRADNNPEESGIHTDVLVAEFPKKDGKSLKVKKIL